MDVIRKIGNNETVEKTTTVLITWHDGQSRLGVDFRALNNYTKGDRYPMPRIPHALDKLEKANYKTKKFGIKNSRAHFQRMMDTIFKEEILEGWMVVYIDDIIIYSEAGGDHMQYIDSVGL
ncbi:hypothetical protein O181_099904 [Austropuccinia psidii MF-1]|uniref:Reverse transcriptase domain-containing protein n=1 Tax=Austropuccinia psidii MF-1 TaxID=1389203 RepID=A0A9Q3JDL2_9BASI|nr:hypothetical protein [Austropuccinia psidii MF-1]